VSLVLEDVMSRSKLTGIFLWLAVLSWGVGLGAKLFDLLVVARAWGASPPASLVLYPYGRAWPLNPGDFFQPLSVLILAGALGALISGWKTAAEYRVWLWLPVIAFVLIWIATPTVFWPIINELYAVAHGKVVKSDIEIGSLVQRWFLYDWLRAFAIAIGFVSSVRAISIPYPQKQEP
jgi:hypothetical protein